MKKSRKKEKIESSEDSNDSNDSANELFLSCINSPNQIIKEGTEAEV